MRILTGRLDNYTTIVDISTSLLLAYITISMVVPVPANTDNIQTGAGAANDRSRCHCCDGPGAGAAACQGAGTGQISGCQRIKRDIKGQKLDINRIERISSRIYMD